MAFSHRQLIYAEYLMEKIGFTEQDAKIYLDNLERVYGKYIRESESVTYPSGYVGERWWYRYDTSDCINQLVQETKIKKNLGSIKLKDTTKIKNISATDLANYSFCPVSYVLNKSFEIEFPTNEDKRIVGLNLHETLRLINKKIPAGLSESDLVSYEVSEDQRIKKIKDCRLIYSGHTDNSTFFKKDNYIGQPDYIFQDPKGAYFVVEEKFKFKSTYNQENNNEQNYFYENHLVQIQSYINFIQEYKIEYGVLIYWLYDFYSEQPYIHTAKLKVIKQNEYLTALNRSYQSIEQLLEDKDVDYISSNYNKCVSCVVNKYCVHKTNTQNSLKIPYNRYIMKLKDVAFPDDLKDG